MNLDEMKNMFGEIKRLDIRVKARPTVVLADNGKTCKDCKHAVRRQRSKVYHKCLLNRNRWTCGTGTDIRLKDPACAMFEQEEKQS